MNIKRHNKILLALTALLFVGVFGLSGCGKEIDRGAVKAQKVEGTYNLWWFCHPQTLSLIFFEDNGMSDDEYVLVWPGACTSDGKAKDMSGSNPIQPNEPGGDN